MGGGQSHRSEADDGGEEPEPPQAPEEPDKPDSSEDTPGELPQCRMGNRKVDNMCFMISCTNWY